MTHRIAAALALSLLCVVAGCKPDPAGGRHEDADHDDHDEPAGPIKLSPQAIDEAGIEIAEADGGPLRRWLALSGEVLLNPDRLAHVVPRVGGIVRQVHKTVGDSVEANEVIALIESRELAEAKAAYLAGKQRLSLAHANVAANEELRAKGIVPDLEFLAARRDLADAEIELRAAEFMLHTLGLTNAEIAALAEQDDRDFLLHELRAPFPGAVIARHITLGEVVSTETNVFEVADLSEVWVNLTVYQKDLESVRPGQDVTVTAGHDIAEGGATIDYVSPVVDEATRTAIARVILPNPDGRWRPGLFVTGGVEIGSVDVAVRVPRTALQTVEDQTCVFVETPAGFEPRPVEIGSSDAAHVEIKAGLHPGERYVAAGAFSLKAELAKGHLGGGHAH